jgi:cytochrome c peroxidase
MCRGRSWGRSALRFGAGLALAWSVQSCASGEPVAEHTPDATGRGQVLGEEAERAASREPRTMELGPQRLPRRIGTPLTANGHAQSWDGRLFIGSREVAPEHVAWVMHVIRPEAMTTDDDGRPRFASLDQVNAGAGAAFSPQVLLEEDGDGLGSHNALAIVPDPDFAPRTPFSSTADCTADEGGAFSCYRMVLFTQDYLNGSPMQLRRLAVVVAEPETELARIERFFFVDDGYRSIATVSGSEVTGIEPTVTADGRLLVYQEGDQLRYVYNDEPCAYEGWSEPRPLVDLHYRDHTTLVDGARMDRRYPLAREPLRDARGNPLPPGHQIRGAYPWISLSGESLVFTATESEDGATRAGLSVVSPLTGYAVRHIDGPLNPNRRSLRLFHSSPGETASLWPPYPGVRQKALPMSPLRPVLPLFGSNTSNYGEVSFQSFADPDAILHLGMNELIDAGGNVVPTETPDVSGSFLTGTLTGARFPVEQTGNDESFAGANGQAVYFPVNAAVTVPARNAASGNPGLDAVRDALSVELFVKPLVDLDGDEENRYQLLLNRPGQVDLVLEENRQVQASFVLADGTRLRSGFVGPELPLAEWSHVVASWDGGTGRFRVFVDGETVFDAQEPPSPLARPGSDLIVGPGGQQPAAPRFEPPHAIMMLDEVRIAKRALSPWEVAGHAYRERTLDLPAGLDARELTGAIPDRNPAAVALGERLFFDPRLSESGEVSCASCHRPELGFTDGLAIAEGEGLGEMNTPQVFNRAFSRAQMWDGRSPSLTEQMVLPIENPVEMNSSVEDALALVERVPAYLELFDRAFGAPPSRTTLGRAFAAYQESLLRGEAPADRFELGEDVALSQSARRGRDLFFGAARCVACHSGSNYSDERFHDNGLTEDAPPGRMAVTGHPADEGAFKTPSLRNLDVTGPFMHDGSIASLEEVVDRYAEGGLGQPTQSPEVVPLELDQGDKDDLLAFLQSLADETPVPDAPTLPPESDPPPRTDDDGLGTGEDGPSEPVPGDDPSPGGDTDPTGPDDGPEDPTPACDLDALGSASGSEAAVRYAYCLVLQRSADDAGLAYYRGELAAGAMTQAELAEQLFFSDEVGAMGLNDASFVDRVYERLLDRRADDAGIRYMMGRLRDEGPAVRRDLVRDVIYSDEFCGSHRPLHHAGCS